MKTTLKEIFSHGAMIWKIIVGLIVIVATGTTLYASLNNKVNTNCSSISNIEIDNAMRDLKQEKLEAFMIRQEVQYQYISTTLDKIEKKLDDIDKEKR